MTASPLPTVGLVFGYLRKSTEEAERQVMSLERQREAIEQFVAARRWPAVSRWFEDAQSGKSFDRPGYQALLAACAAQPHVGGCAIVLDYDRFARPVNGALQFDDIEFQRQRIRFHDVGWSLEYVLTPTTGDAKMDSFMRAMKVAGAGEYLEKLSTNVRSGKRKLAERGLWGGGPAPFPADRYDARSGRVLARGERAPNGCSVLGPPADPAALAHWIDAAERYVAGAPYTAIVEEFRRRGVRTYHDPSGVREWHNSEIRKMLTNRALIGELETKITLDDRTVRIIRSPAQWAPIVPVALFHAVQEAVTTRTGRGRGKRGQAAARYPLRILCARCGVVYSASTRGRRYYVHPVPPANMSAEQAAKIRRAGCRSWSIVADEAEAAVYDIILSQRLTREFATAFRGWVAAETDTGPDDGTRRKEIERRLRDLERRRENLLNDLEAADDAVVRRRVLDRVTARTREIAELEGELRAMDTARGQASDRNQAALGIVDAADALRVAFADDSPEALARKREAVAAWVKEITVAVESRGPGSRRDPKTIEVTLTRFPHTRFRRVLGEVDMKSAHAGVLSDLKGYDRIAVTLLAPSPKRIRQHHRDRWALAQR